MQLKTHLFDRNCGPW